MERIVITGPTGWIGKAMLALLHRDGDADALAAGGQILLFGSRAGQAELPGGGALPIRQLAELSGEVTAGAHVIHLAYLTKDKLDLLGEDVFRRTNTAIDAQVLSALRDGRPASVFVASSGAARLAQDGVDTHPYGLTKLEQEAAFLAFAQETGVPVLCGRIYNVAGPWINKLEAYAVSNFAQQALATGCIRINAHVPVFRSMLHIEDLCRLVLRAARARLGRITSVDLCGTEMLEMRDIADLVAESTGRNICIERPGVDYAGSSSYLGDATQTRVLALELNVCLLPAAVQVSDMVEWMARHAQGEVESSGQIS